jgi:hypothetical protein
MLGGLIDVALDPSANSPQFFESVPPNAVTNATAALR